MNPVAKEFHLVADAESERYGIWSIEFHEEEFKTNRFEMKLIFIAMIVWTTIRALKFRKKATATLSTTPKNLTVQSNILIDVN